MEKIKAKYDIENFVKSLETDPDYQDESDLPVFTEAMKKTVHESFMAAYQEAKKIAHLEATMY